MDGGTFKLMINYQIKVCSILCFEDLDVVSLMTVLEITDIASINYTYYLLHIHLVILIAFVLFLEIAKDLIPSNEPRRYSTLLMLTMMGQ